MIAYIYKIKEYKKIYYQLKRQDPIWLEKEKARKRKTK